MADGSRTDPRGGSPLYLEGMSGVPTSDPPAPVPSAASILEGIAQVAREHLDWSGPLRPEMHLVEDLELDSIRLLTLAVEVENHFRVALDEADEEEIDTVGDLVEAVRRKLSSP